MDVAALAARDRGGPRRGPRPRRGRRDGRDDDASRPSTRSTRSRTSARKSASGCTSTPRTRARPRSCRRCARSSRAGSGPTRVLYNPHKWMLVPLECTGLFFRRMERVRRAFSVVPNYLETPEGQTRARVHGLRRPARAALPRAEDVDDAPRVRRRGRPGAHRGRARATRGGCAASSRRSRTSTIVAPTPFSVVAFRWQPAGHGRRGGRRGERADPRADQRGRPDASSRTPS